MANRICSVVAISIAGYVHPKGFNETCLKLGAFLKSDGLKDILAIDKFADIV